MDNYREIVGLLIGFQIHCIHRQQPISICQGKQVGVAHIRWLSELGQFDFDIKYRTGRSNKAADSLSHHLYIPGEIDGGSDSEGYETISYATVCAELKEMIDVEKVPIDSKVAIQENQNNPAKQDLELHASVIEILR